MNTAMLFRNGFLNNSYLYSVTQNQKNALKIPYALYRTLFRKFGKYDVICCHRPVLCLQ